MAARKRSPKTSVGPSDPVAIDDAKSDETTPTDETRRPDMIIACFIVIFALTRFGQKWLKHGKIIRSNFDTQPLVTITPSKFDAETGSTLTQCSTNHPLIGKSTLYGNNFADSQGFVVKFNTEGVSDFKDSSELACLFPFFDAVRDPAANAFVLNVLHVDPDTNDHPIRWHLDQTVGIYSTNMYTAHTVSVWYARVPPKMSGGELEISAYNTSSFGGGGRPEDVVKECSPEWTRSGAPNKEASSSLERNPGAETGGAEAEYGDPADFEAWLVFGSSTRQKLTRRQPCRPLRPSPARGAAPSQRMAPQRGTSGFVSCRGRMPWWLSGATHFTGSPRTPVLMAAPAPVPAA
mmetsp:Transcript_57681/g.130700  ORF Transcript_57681/g.130700 Transcript_57681/m.130700 type:complete len:349 (+) Transcript_57681:37-1083(+)